MTKKLTFLLGGARSGKSAYAQALAQECPGQVVYVATAQAGDEEMRQRIAIHRADRPAHWATVEAPSQVARAVQAQQPAADLYLLDCMTLLVSNILLALPEDVSLPAALQAAQAEAQAILAAYEAGSASWIIVSNEVGLGLVPPYPLGRLYRDVLGKVNQQLAARADQVLFLVAGIPMAIKG